MSMTTPTTSRVSDAMVEVAENAFWPVYLESIRVHQASKASHSAGMRAALEAAIASQGDVVAVSVLEDLVRVAERSQIVDEHHPQCSYGMGIVISELRAILAGARKS